MTKKRCDVKLHLAGALLPLCRAWGLAINKEFIEAQGGRIWVDSEMGLSSCFSFSLQA
jgi:light-regulated signal transduction histidine kinase (bacteriophytochrome)